MSSFSSVSICPNIQMANIRRNKSKPWWDTTSHLSEWLKLTTQGTTNVGKDVEKGCNPLTPLVGIQTSAATLENSMEVPQKIKNITALWSSNWTTRYLFKGYRNAVLKGHMHPNVYSSAVNNSQSMERAHMSLNWWMGKEDVVCVCVCICVCVCVCVCMYVYIYIYIYTHTYIYIHTHTHICIYIHTMD